MSSLNPKLCISLLPQSEQELQQWLPECLAADYIEVRMDLLSEAIFPFIASQKDKHFIITLRTPQEGGQWQGAQETFLKTYQAAIDAAVDYIDIEWSAADILENLQRTSGTQIILSHHIENAPSIKTLKQRLKQMSAIPADVYKLIFTASTLSDNLKALTLIEYAKSLQLNFIVHAMGDAGIQSRLIGALKGNMWAYVSRNAAAPTAAGQLTLHQARQHYFLPQKSSQTQISGLVGNPIAQSSGWRLHNALIQQERSAESDNDYIYMNFPADDFDNFWENWQNHLQALSITLPYKEDVIKHLEHLSSEVKISGVCNTIVKQSDQWHGYNTDLLAMETLLRPHQERIHRGGLIIGTGATCRTAIAALKRMAISPIFVLGRNIERGKFLAETFGIDFLTEDEAHYASASVIIQTTPVGMFPDTNHYPLGTSHFRNGRVVLDVIHNPRETRFLQIAKERNCITISGVEMFLVQAAKQFEIFTGKALPLPIIQKLWEKLNI